MKKKSIYLYFTCLSLLVLGMIPIQELHSQNPIRFRVENASVMQGDELTVALRADSLLTNREVYSYRFHLTYNANYLEFLEVSSTGSVLNNWGLPTINSNTAGQLIIAGAGASPLSGNGEMFFLKFRARTGGTIGINFNTANSYLNDGSPNITFTNGTINISTVPLPAIYPSSSISWVGEQYTVSGSSGKPPYVFHSTNPAIATINSSTGLATAVSPGKTTLYLIDDNGNRSTNVSNIDVRGVRLRVNNVSTTVQEQFYLPVQIEIAPGTQIYSGSFDLTFSSAIEGITSANTAGDFIVSFQNNVVGNSVKVSFASATPLTGEGILRNIGFISRNSGSTTVNITNAQFNEDLQAFVHSGVVTSECLPTEKVINMMPENGATNQNTTVNLYWQRAVNAKSYNLFLWEDGTAVPTTAFRTYITATTTSLSNLDPGKTYRWKIVSVNECSTIESDEQTFTVLGLPDLIIENIQAPASVQSGETFTVTFKVKNIGQVSTGTSQWRDAVYISTSNNFSQSKTLLATQYNPSKLDADQSYSQSYSVKMPNEFTGTYYLFVSTDNNSTVRELSETNNVNLHNQTISVALMPFPDIMVKDITATSSSFTPGDTLTVNWKVENIGNADGNGGWSERITLVSETGRSVSLSPNPTYNADVAVGETVIRSSKFILPASLRFSGNAQIEVELIASSSLIELTSAKANNKALSTDFITVNDKLFIHIGSSALSENSTNVVGVRVSRSGDLSADLLVNLSASPIGNINLPANITIPANSNSANFNITAIDNQIVDGDRVVEITASAANHIAAVGNIQILDNEAAVLSAVLDRTTANEGDILNLTITRNLVTSSPLTVYIATDKSNQWSFVNAVIIPAGEASVTVPINVTQDDIPEVNSDVKLTISAGGFMAVTVTAHINDDDIPEFTFTLQNDTVSEGAGMYATYGVITRNGGNNELRVNLSSSVANALILPNQIVLPAGRNEIKFNIGVVDNALVDGLRTIKITGALYISSCNCTAAPSSNGAVSVPLVIVDNDGPALTVFVNPASIYEGKENGGMLKITRNTLPDDALTIYIIYDQPSEAIIANTAIIPAGEIAVEVPITTINDGIQDGNKLVNVTVNATGFSPGIGYFYVTDLNKPDYELKNISVSTTNAVAGGSIQISGILHNKGYLLAPIGSSIGFYITGKPYLQTNDAVFGQFQSQTSIAISDSIPFMQTLMLPKKTGTYYLIAKANPSEIINELVYSNNVAEAISITIQPEYTATASVVPKQLLPNNPVTITGKATKINGEPAANSAVDVYVLNNGTRRVIKTTTDVSGNYTAQFSSQNESGHYAVGACYPGELLNAVMDEFDILGKVRTSNEHVVWLTKKEQPLTSTIQIRNTSNVPLHNVKLAAINSPNGFSMSSNTISVLPGNSTAEFNVTVVGSEASTANDYLKIPIEITSDENTEFNFTAYYFCQELQSALITNPASINTSMTKGYSKIYELVVRNNGAGETGKTKIVIPETPFMRLISSDTIANIPPLGEAKITLEFTPTADMPLNTPFTGQLAINPTHGKGINVPYKIDHISDVTGSLNIIAKNEYSYNTVEKPNLANAHVVVRHPYSGAVMNEGFTGSDGMFLTSDIPEGHYTVTVQAEKHDGWQGTVLVEAGKTVDKAIFLSFKAITYTWEVIRTEIEDEYKIDLIMEFETNVPKPVVIMEMPDSMPQLSGDEIYSFLVTVTNKGLITARDYQIHFPDNDPEYEFVTNFTKSDLLAQQAIQIPVIFKRRASAGGSQGIPGMMRASNSSGNCRDFVQDVHWFECGPDNQFQQGQKLFTFSGRSCPGGGISGVSVGGGWSATPSMGGAVGGSGGATVYSSGGGTIPVMTPLGCRETECLINILKTIMDCYPVTKTLKTAGKAGKCATKLAKSGLKKKSCIGPEDLFDCVETSYEMVVSCWAAFGPGAGGNSSMGIKTFDRNKIQQAMSTTTNSNDEYLTSRFELLGLSQKYLSAISNLKEIYFGNLNVSNRENFEDFYNEVSNVTQFDTKFTETDVNRIKSALETSDISESEIDYFTARWNRTLDAYASNIFSSNEAFPDIMDLDLTEFYSEQADSITDFAINNGYYNAYDLIAITYEEIVDELTKKQSAVCASVTIQISQRMVMTREAFEGTLSINNGSDVGAMKNIKLDIEIKNSKGEIANDLFQINTKALDILTGIDGTGELAMGQKGSATILMIPTKNAAPQVPESYSFGGTFSYLDPSTETVVTSPLFPVTLDVMPSPELHLHYFMQRDILGDDPLTEKIEPVVPAELALMIHNEGFGEARNVRVESAQPEIIENEKGLAIHFELIGSNFNGQPMQLGVTNIDFGTIAPKKTAIGQWWLTSNLMGHFISYKTNVVHTSSYGNPDLSLVSGATLHELIKSVNVYTHSDGINDFLVNEVVDFEDTPDMLYLTDGTKQSVAKATGMTLLSGISGPEYLAEIKVDPMLYSWNYGKMNDPANGRFTIASVTRKHDNFVLPIQNVWQTHVTMVDNGDPIYENKLHLLDNFENAETQNYLIRYVPLPVNTPKVIEVIGVPANVTNTQLTTIDVVFNQEIDVTSFTFEDLILRLQGGENIIDNGVTITQLTPDRYTIDFGTITSGDGFYVLTINTSGIRSLDGVFGTEDWQAAWTQFVHAPSVVEFIGLPENNVGVAFDDLLLQFNRSIIPTTLTADILSLLKDGMAIQLENLTITPMDEENSLFKIAGLSGFMVNDGHFDFNIDLTEVRTDADVPGLITQTVSWIIDTTPPSVSSLHKFTNGGFDGQHVTNIEVKFTEPISGFGISALELWKDEVRQPLSQLHINAKDSITFALSEFRLLTYDEGEYTLVIKLSNLEDEAGIAGIGVYQTSWVVDRSLPPAITNLRITPDLGISDTDGITKNGDLKAVMDVNASNMRVQIYQNTSGDKRLLADLSDVAAGNLEVPISVETFGSSVLEAYCIDNFGNSIVTEIPIYIDNQPLNATTNLATTAALSRQPDSIRFVFSDKLLDELKIKQAISASFNFNSISTSNVTVLKISDTQYEIGNLRAVLGNSSGVYSVTVNTAELNKHNSGKSGELRTSVSWNLQVNNAPVAHAGSHQAVNAAELVTLDGTASSDMDGDALTYQWIAPFGIVLNDNSSPTPTFVAPQYDVDLVFTLIVNDSKTNSGESSVVISVRSVPTLDQNPTQSLMVYPNPARDFIKLQGFTDKSEVQIIDMTGQLVLRKEISPNETLDINRLKQGLYLLKINNSTIKLVVK